LCAAETSKRPQKSSVKFLGDVSRRTKVTNPLLQGNHQVTAQIVQGDPRIEWGMIAVEVGGAIWTSCFPDWH